MSIHYGTIPTAHSARESLWVQLRYPAPASITYGIIVQFKSKVPEVIFPNSKFKVSDVIGTRVVLIPLDEHWTPSIHSPGPWGYTMKDWSNGEDYIHSSGYRNWTYHGGRSIGIMYW